MDQYGSIDFSIKWFSGGGGVFGQKKLFGVPPRPCRRTREGGNQKEPTKSRVTSNLTHVQGLKIVVTLVPQTTPLFAAPAKLLGKRDFHCKLILIFFFFLIYLFVCKRKKEVGTNKISSS